MSGIFFNGKWMENADLVCRKCSGAVYETDDLRYICPHCGVELEEAETDAQDGLTMSSVLVARPVDGITLNSAMEYLLDDDGNKLVFENQAAAEAFLMEHGYTEYDLDQMYFEEIREEAK